MHFKKIIIKKAFLVVVLRLCEHGKDWQNGCGCTPSAGAVPMPCLPSLTVVYTTVTVRRFAPPRLARFCQPLPCSHSHKTTTRKAFLMIIFLKFIYFVVVFRWNHGNRASSKRNYQKIKIYLFFTLIQRISLIPKLDFQIY